MEDIFFKGRETRTQRVLNFAEIKSTMILRLGEEVRKIIGPVHFLIGFRKRKNKLPYILITEVRCPLKLLLLLHC